MGRSHLIHLERLSAFYLKNDVKSAGEALLNAYQFLINKKNFNNKLKPLCRENYSEDY